MASADSLKLVSALLYHEEREAAGDDVEWAIGRIAELEAALREIAILDDVRADEAAGIARRALER